MAPLVLEAAPRLRPRGRKDEPVSKRPQHRVPAQRSRCCPLRRPCSLELLPHGQWASPSPAEGPVWTHGLRPPRCPRGLAVPGLSPDLRPTWLLWKNPPAAFGARTRLGSERLPARVLSRPAVPGSAVPAMSPVPGRGLGSARASWERGHLLCKAQGLAFTTGWHPVALLTLPQACPPEQPGRHPRGG